MGFAKPCGLVYPMGPKQEFEIGGNILGIAGKIVGVTTRSAVGAVKGVFTAIFD